MATALKTGINNAARKARTYLEQGANFVTKTGSFKKSQNSVLTQSKKHGLFLTIHLKSKEAKQCVGIAAQLQKYVEEVEKVEPKDEIVAGVGFSPDLCSKVNLQTKDFSYKERNNPANKNKDADAHLPNTGGDIFIHAKSDSISQLFDLCKKIKEEFPAGVIQSFEDVYGFGYENGRDLSGFIDGTANRKDLPSEEKVAVEKETGGSYVLTQRWEHKMSEIERLLKEHQENILELWVGRTRESGEEMNKKMEAAHIVKMRGQNGFASPPEWEILRQSMPIGALGDNASPKAGLFFLAYSNNPESFDFMLDQMVGTKENDADMILMMSWCATGATFYFPGVDQLQELAAL